MDGKKLILFLFFMFGMVLGLKAQTIPYTYVDPCTGVLTTVQVPTTSGTVTMFYGGQYQTFTYAQLQAGAYDQWVNSINSQFPPGTDPCAGLGGDVTLLQNPAIVSEQLQDMYLYKTLDYNKVIKSYNDEIDTGNFPSYQKKEPIQKQTVINKFNLLPPGIPAGSIRVVVDGQTLYQDKDKYYTILNGVVREVDIDA